MRQLHALTGSRPSLAETHPTLRAQADGWDPSETTAGSNARRAWICPLGHRWEARVANRARGAGCPFCKGRRAMVRFNDLASLHPTIAADADGWDPTTLTAGAKQVKAWRCRLGHRWETSVCNRVGRGSGCPVCAGQRVEPGVSDLATVRPDLAAQAHGWDPATVMPGSTAQRQWACALGHTWRAAVVDRSHGRGCPFCAGKRAWRGFNDLATTHPILALEAQGWDPSGVTAGSDASRLWRGACGHSWSATVSHRRSGRGCPFCAGRRVMPGFNDLATTHPALASEAAGWNPSAVTAGSHAKRLWRAPCGHTWCTPVKNRAAGSGCPSCASHGFNPSKQAWLYVLVASVQCKVVVQFGITTSPTTRLSAHRRAGFVSAPFALVPYGTGEEAAGAERALMALQVSCGVPTAAAGGVRFSGSTEAFLWAKSAHGFAEDLCSALDLSFAELSEAADRCQHALLAAELAAATLPPDSPYAAAEAPALLTSEGVS